MQSFSLADMLFNINNLMNAEQTGFDVSFRECQTKNAKSAFLSDCIYLTYHGWNDDFYQKRKVVDENAGLVYFNSTLEQLMRRPLELTARWDSVVEEKYIDDLKTAIVFFTRMYLLRHIFQLLNDNKQEDNIYSYMTLPMWQLLYDANNRLKYECNQNINSKNVITNLNRLMFHEHSSFEVALSGSKKKLFILSGVIFVGLNFFLNKNTEDDTLSNISISRSLSLAIASFAIALIISLWPNPMNQMHLFFHNGAARTRELQKEFDEMNQKFFSFPTEKELLEPTKHRDFPQARFKSCIIIDEMPKNNNMRRL